MYFKQVLRTDIGCAGYLIGSSSGDAAVVDPRIDMVDELLALLEQEQLRLRFIIETHNHADHVSGHLLLAERTGAVILVHEDAGVAYAHGALCDDQELVLGEVRLRVIHTPGHRPEHIAIAVIDTSRGSEPWLVLTGDSLFIGDVARPDLAIPGEQGAAMLFHSLRDRLLTLPDGTLAYPAHVSGSLCGHVTSRMTATSVGYERAFNPALAIGDEAEFVRYTTESLPERPLNLARIVEINKSAEPAPVGSARMLSLGEFTRLRADGALTLDVRAPDEFTEGHILGAISVQIESTQFPNRAGLTISADADLVLVAETEVQARTAITALSVIGYGRVLGFLVLGPHMLERASKPLETLPRMSVFELRDQLEKADHPFVLDVRERSEWEEGHILGSVNIPFYQVADHLHELDRTQSIAVICASGHRSVIAASVLQSRGFDSVYNVVGGMAAWNRSKALEGTLPTAR